ncbi:hypothetical protein I6A84_27985 [Frankia sp. CNm7]|uniref:Uncharacterized protein n=1 Tax=Frankia nepalensis TaxID=1836974 RepID=A0A937RCR6_9ACTN|nr:hypothetical protein [Frankia nepalensis]MBL7500548.1 hypothetical protein [Frankia nepalensis]MBL7509758.1 hypothetical protein [Frankia nepalensis]MBL7521816.1 hypothetical protein [Frankia nepalensis]MBL7627877.1 hypothetical protein [Frankia nepalensis]
MPEPTATPSEEPELTDLGGFSGDRSLSAYCQSLGFADAVPTQGLDGPAEGNWRCWTDEANNQPINFGAACGWAYAGSVRAASPSGRAYGWRCYG